MLGEYIVRRNGKLETYNNYYDIPDDFEHLIKFLPDVPPPPHTPEQHKEIDNINNMLLVLMDKERNRSKR